MNRCNFYCKNWDKIRYFIVIPLAIIIFLLVVFFPTQAKEKFFETKLWQKIHPKSAVNEPEEIIVFKNYDFSQDNSLKGWKNKIFKGLTKYWLDSTEIGKSLHSKSEKTASALYCMVSYKIKDYPILSWEWHPVKFPHKTNVDDPLQKDDYALRIYVLFASGFFTNFKCVEYVWDEFMKEGKKQISPYSDKIRQIVVRSGPVTENWVVEARNVYQDYIDLFGEAPTIKVKAIAVMSDSEGSESSSEGYIKEIKILKKL